jgi:hypothetical protein
VPSRAGARVVADLARSARVGRFRRTLRAWRAKVLAYFDTGGVSNGGTEAINLIIEKTRPLAHGFRTFTHLGLRILHPAFRNTPFRRETAHAQIRRATNLCRRGRRWKQDRPSR